MQVADDKDGVLSVRDIVLREASRLLGRPVVGTDDFFRVGGDSLKAARLAMAIMHATKTRVSLTSVFNRPVLNDLASECEVLADDARLSPRALPEHPRESAQQDVPTVTYNQAFRLERDTWPKDGGREPHHIEVMFDVFGELDLAILEQAARDVVRRHDVLAHGFAMVGDVPTAWPLESFPPIIEEIELPAGTKRDFAVQTAHSASQKLFQLESDAKLRLSVVKWGERRHTLLCVTVEHLCCDGESLAPLLHDLGAAYSARLANDAPIWGEPVPTFGDWVHWEHREYGGDGLSRRLSHWRSRLDPFAPIPYAFLRGSVTPSDLTNLTAARTGTYIEEQDLSAFRSALRSYGSTPYMGVCVAVVVACLTQGSGSIVGISTPMANRPYEWRNAVGWLAATGLFRLTVDTNDRIDAILGSVRSELALTGEHLLPVPALLSHFTPNIATGRYWRPRLYLDVASGGSPTLLIAGAVTRYIKDIEGVALRDGIALWGSLEQGLELKMQYAPQHLSSAIADEFIASVGAVIKDFQNLLPMTVADAIAKLTTSSRSPSSDKSRNRGAPSNFSVGENLNAAP